MKRPSRWVRKIAMNRPRAVRVRVGILAGSALLAGAFALPGCVAAAAVVTTAVAVELVTEQGYTLTIKAEAPARDLYEKLVAVLKSRNPDLEVVKENLAKREFSARVRDLDGGRKWVSFVVSPLPDESSQLLVAAGYDGKEGRKIRDWMLQRIDEVFAELDIEWRIASAGGDSARRVASSG